MLIDLKAEILNIKDDEKSLRHMVSDGDQSAKMKLAMLLAQRGGDQNIECKMLLHELSTDPNIVHNIKLKSTLLLGDLALADQAFGAAENYYKQAMDLGYIEAIDAIKHLYNAGYVKHEVHHDDYNNLYINDIAMAKQLSKLEGAMKRSMRGADMQMRGQSNQAARKSSVKSAVGNAQSSNHGINIVN
jgi:hypothetical protein